MFLHMMRVKTNKVFQYAAFCFFIVLTGCAYIAHSAVDNHDSPHAVAVPLPPVSIWPVMQQNFALTPLPSPLVARQIQRYASSGLHLQESLTLAKPYLYFVLEEVNKRNMPAELALLPFLESSFNVRRGKGLNSAGLWGLMPITARHLNLANTPFKDDRRDVVRSTEAALDLMQELFLKYGDWHLALAAYNWGPGNVTKAIEQNKRRKLPTDYLSLNIPAETSTFVPKLLALRQVIENPSQYNVVLPDIPHTPYFVQIEVKHAIDILTVLKLANISSDEFIDLNPAFNKTIIPAGDRQVFLLPVKTYANFERGYQSYELPLSQWRSVIVEQPQTIDALSKKWGVDAHRTRQMNQLLMGITLQAGAMVLIPKPSFKDD